MVKTYNQLLVLQTIILQSRKICQLDSNKIAQPCLMHIISYYVGHH